MKTQRKLATAGNQSRPNCSVGQPLRTSAWVHTRTLDGMPGTIGLALDAA